jgi:hypothetical protein
MHVFTLDFIALVKYAPSDLAQIHVIPSIWSGLAALSDKFYLGVHYAMKSEEWLCN